MLKSRTYEQEVTGYLQDSELAIEYLNVALEEGDLELFWNALQNVAKAKGKSEQLAIQVATIGGQGNQLFFLLKELGLGLKSIDLSQVEAVN
jgi:DNA-binding phage protein